MNLSENILALRTRLNFSQGELANALEVSRQSVSKWENSSAQPELDKLVRMSQLFNVTLDELVFGNIEKKQPDEYVSPRQSQRRIQSRVVAGTAMLVLGVMVYLLSMFWGNQLPFAEQVAELIAITLVMLSISMLATYHTGVLVICGITYMLYAVVCFGVLQVSNLLNDLFLAVVSIVLLAWFIVWGMQGERNRKK